MPSLVQGPLQGEATRTLYLSDDRACDLRHRAAKNSRRSERGRTGAITSDRAARRLRLGHAWLSAWSSPNWADRRREWRKVPRNRKHGASITSFG
jgi:hypothetical protein